MSPRCTCAADGNAGRCSYHTQADFDAQKPSLQVTEQGLRTFSQKVLSLGWEYGQGYHTGDGAQFQLRRYLREFFDVES